MIQGVQTVFVVSRHFCDFPVRDAPPLSPQVFRACNFHFRTVPAIPLRVKNQRTQPPVCILLPIRLSRTVQCSQSFRACLGFLCLILTPVLYSTFLLCCHILGGKEYITQDARRYSLNIPCVFGPLRRSGRAFPPLEERGSFTHDRPTGLCVQWVNVGGSMRRRCVAFLCQCRLPRAYMRTRRSARPLRPVQKQTMSSNVSPAR